MNVEKAIVDAVRMYADLQSQGGIISTLPCNCETIDQITSQIDERIKKNSRIKPLNDTLFVHNPRYYGNHNYFAGEDSIGRTWIRDTFQSNTGVDSNWQQWNNG